MRETTVPWIRMLYLYSTGLTPRVLELMATEPRILPYLDMPIQHGSDRGARADASSRAAADDSRPRATHSRRSCPTSRFARRASSDFPGETEEDFETLLAFLEEMQFDRVGAFTYSPQEGTRAAEMDDDVPDDVKQRAPRAAERDCSA